MKSNGLSQSRTVLLVDSLDQSRISIKWFLTSFGCIVDAVQSAEDAITVFDAATHDLVISDYLMPGMNGVELAHIIKMRSPSTLIVMYSQVSPADQSCLDLFIHRPENGLFRRELRFLKDAIDDLLIARVEHAF